MIRTVALHVSEAGWLSTYQDLGRTGAEALGVPCGGAADQHSAAVANILVGNARNATLLEILGGTFAFTPDADVLVAVTGTETTLTVDGLPTPLWEPVVVPAGSRVRLGPATGGLRSYLAIGGELAAPRFLGSAAPDARMRFPQLIARGDTLGVHSGPVPATHPDFGVPLYRFPVPRLPLPEGTWTLDLVEGPETAAVPGIRELLATSTYTVGPQSDRVGLRLDGPVLHPQGLGEIVSHGVPVGALEIPHSDELIILGRYRTLTAGYPIVAFVTTACQDLLGQAGPGRTIGFRWVDEAAAVRGLRESRQRLDFLEARVKSAYAACGTSP
ncbi:biotin-dependent carboxyltransferase family protein [Specibacter cremeus]|uniref:5-oxoprolinase subunit C family protein n=1 Tax=Specibacter cremeus TaxID=1629051 RepID=UPI000F77B3FB|nr:biotin-dependent carboxyltransferase family protein [Specibacter cremeus]